MAGTMQIVIRPTRGAEMYKNLLVATDGSKLSDKALTHAIASPRP